MARNLSAARGAAITFAAIVLATPIVTAQTARDPGISDTEITIGQTAPLSGPVSIYATFSRASAAYFKMINAKGGVAGRTINLLTVDDGFSPPRTVEQTRKLVESDQVFAIYAPTGSASSIAVQKYLNAKRIPQFLIQSGLARWNNPKEYPWSLSGLPNYDVEVKIYTRYIMATMPNARIAVLYQNDEYGMTYLNALKEGMGAKASQIVAMQSFDINEPTVNSQIINLAADKPDVLLIGATAKQTVQAIQKSAELGWHPQYFVAYPAASVERTYKIAGAENAKGAISATAFKDPSDPDTAGDTDVKDYLVWMAEYYPTGDKFDTLNVAAYVEAAIFVEVLKRCGKDLSRDSFLKAATSLSGFTIPMLRSGTTVQTDASDYNLFRTLQLIKFDGARNVALALP